MVDAIWWRQINCCWLVNISYLRAVAASSSLAHQSSSIYQCKHWRNINPTSYQLLDYSRCRLQLPATSPLLRRDEAWWCMEESWPAVYTNTNLPILGQARGFTSHWCPMNSGMALSLQHSPKMTKLIVGMWTAWFFGWVVVTQLALPINQPNFI